MRLPRGARYEKCRGREIFVQETAEYLRGWHDLLIAEVVTIDC
jgi:hypothetical protein